jgi:hypothetical protein
VSQGGGYCNGHSLLRHSAFILIYLTLKKTAEVSEKLPLEFVSHKKLTEDELYKLKGASFGGTLNKLIALVKRKRKPFSFLCLNVRCGQN